ncbi:MAG: glycosyltransferase family 2 protein [Bacteroidetes bacterium]|nr:glycosyltransferase family 2 protein [Bacteroidota bacterium]
MIEKPLVSIITVNYHQEEVTCQMLESMRHVTYPNVEVIVVDNDSRTPLEKIASGYPEARVIRSEANLGFAGGNNLGIRNAKGKYLLFLNNDTEVEQGFLEPLVELLESDTAIGMVSPKIKFFYHPDTIQYAGFSKVNPFTLRIDGIGFGKKDNGQYNKIQETHSAHGCAMMVPRAALDHVGLMPEMYFLYYEEHDWSTRFLYAGYKIYYQPDSVILHKEAISTGGRVSKLRTYYFNRNRILFGRRNLKGIYRLFSAMYMIFISVPKNLIVYIIKGEPGHLKAFVKAIGWHFKTIFKKFRVYDKKVH